MVNRIVILTLTYNRPSNIKGLFGTLKLQTCKDFTWYVVNDGSAEDYTSVVEEIKYDADFKFLYDKKENGGKSAAINFAFDNLMADDFVVIVDDDEQLYADAIAKMQSYAERYAGTNIGVINFTRDDINGNPLSNPVIEEDFIMSIQEHKRRNYHSDGYAGYFMNKVGACRFPIFEGEKYVGPSVLIMLVSEKHDLLWTSTSLGYTEYLEGGLTQKGRRLRLKNPKGMAYRCLQMQTKDSGLRNRFLYSIQYYAYKSIANDVQPNSDKKKLFLPIVSKPLGYLLYRWWTR